MHRIWELRQTDHWIWTIKELQREGQTLQLGQSNLKPIVLLLPSRTGVIALIAQKIHSHVLFAEVACVNDPVQSPQTYWITIGQLVHSGMFKPLCHLKCNIEEIWRQLSLLLFVTVQFCFSTWWRNRILHRGFNSARESRLLCKRSSYRTSAVHERCSRC